MKGIRIHLLAQDPLIVTDGSSEGISHACLSYIPGSMLLGALATRWRLTHPDLDPDETDEFTDIFINGAVSFGHAYPTVLGRPCVPTPISFFYSKSKGQLPTFDTNDEEKEPHVYNKLFQQTVDDKTKRLTVPFLDAISKHTPSLSFQQTTHVAINAKNRKAADSRLFSYEAMAPGSRFCSTLLCDDTYVQTVEDILRMDPIIHVGHAKSAGYGTVVITDIERVEGPTATQLTPGDHVLFLESAFFPEKSWESPRDGLRSLFSETTMISFADKLFCKTIRLEGFNNFWYLPRPTRIGFAQGSVIPIQVHQAVTLPPLLGGWTNEGYGRYAIDPELLAKPTITPERITLPTQDTTHPANASPHTTLLSIWRRRSVTRIAHEQALDCVWNSSVFTEFFEDMKKTPTSSQRGNIRNMILRVDKKDWIGSFDEMLLKIPGRQWKRAITRDLFSEHMATLDTIMRNLLDCDRTTHVIEQRDDRWTLPTVAGGPLQNEEKELFRSERHTWLLLELFRRWEREERQGKEKEGEN